MIIKSILFLVKKFKFIDRFINKLSFAYLDFKKIESLKSIDFQEVAIRLAQEDLKRVVAYEKLGELSGYSKPIIARSGE